MRKPLVVLLLLLSLILALAACAQQPAADVAEEVEDVAEEVVEEPVAEEPVEEEPAVEEPVEEEVVEEEPVEEEAAEEGVEEELADVEEEAVPEEAAETTEVEVVASYECTDEIRCIEVPEGEPVEIGYMLVVAGPNEALGVDSRNGMEIAVAEHGEIAGHPIEILGEDEACSPEGGQTAATRITAIPDIAAVVGTSCSSAARVAIPLVTDAGLTMISPSNTAPELTDPERGPEFAGYLRTAHNDLFQGALAAEFAYNELGLTRAATIHDGSIYADGLQSVFAERFTELGGEVVAQEAINVGDTDMRPVLTRIAAEEPEIIYYPVFVQEAALITSQAREVAGLEEVTLMSADGSLSPDFVEAAGDAASGMYMSGPRVAGEEYERFLELHQERFGGAPTAGFHAHAFDATNIILNAIEEVAVATEDGTLNIPLGELREAIFATTNYQGLTGTLSCNEFGDCGTPEAIAVYQITEEAVENPDELLALSDVAYQVGAE